MLVNRNNCLYFFTYLIMTIVFNVLVFFIQLESLNQLKVLGVVCVVELLVFIALNTMMSERFLNFSNIFVPVFFVFNFGQLTIYTFFQKIYSHIRFLNLFDEENAVYCLEIMHVAFSAICVGILFSRFIKVNQNSNDLIKNGKYDWEGICKRIIAITFPVKVVIDVACLYVSMTQGGAAARLWMNDVPSTFIYFGKVALIGFALLIVIYKDKKKFLMFSFIEVYILVVMVSGIRSENVGYLLIIAYIYLATRSKKIRVSSIIACCVIGFFVLTFIVAAGSFRGVEEKSIESFTELFIYACKEKNVVLYLFDTLGDTGYTSMCVIDKWLPLYGPSYGTSYLFGLTAIIPNIPGITNLPGELTEMSCFALHLQDKGTLSPKYLNIGGSVLGEMFFNFGIWGGIIAAVIFGIVIGYISRKSILYLQNNNYIGLIKYIPIMFMCIYWVRHYFGGGVREIVWGPIICLAVLLFSKQKKKTN